MIKHDFLNNLSDSLFKYIPFLKRKRNFVLYCAIGVTGVTLNYAVFFFLVTHVGLHYSISNVLSVICGILNNFFLNSKYNFKVKDKKFRRLIRFYGVGLFGMGVSTSILFLLISGVGLGVLISKVITIPIVLLLQYFLNSRYSFKCDE